MAERGVTTLSGADTWPSASLATNAIGMAIQSRGPSSATLIHSDDGTQFTSWAFTERAKRSGLLPRWAPSGTASIAPWVESFWARMQVDLLNRRRWRTRVELANAIFEHLEIFYNRQRRRSSLTMRTPIQFEKMHSRPSGPFTGVDSISWEYPLE